jgi:CHAT domain-containing protein
MENFTHMKPTYFLVLIILFSFSDVFSQSKYDKMLKAAETSYELGDYSKAISSLEKFKTKAFKKLGKHNVYTPTYFLLNAKYNLASGYISEFESNLYTAINTSISINQENSQEHILILIGGAELHNINGSYLDAKNYLTNAKKIFEGGAPVTDVIKAQWSTALAEALTGQGFYNEAIEILKGQEKFYVGRAVKQESFVDSKGNLSSKKLSEQEIAARYNEYARLLTLLGNAYGKQGSLKSSDSVFVFGANWIRKYMGESTIAYVNNQFLNANILVENGNEDLPRELEYSTTLGNLKTKHKPTHYLAMGIFEETIKQLQRQDRSAALFNTKLEYEKMINKNYKSSSIYYVRLKAVEFDARVDKNKTRTLENDANNLIASTTSLPRNNMVTANVTEFLYGLAINKKNYVNAEKYLNDIIEIKSSLLGSDAPEAHLAKLKLANFYLDNTNKISEASRIYDESYTKIVSSEIGAWHSDHLEILNHIAALYELTDKYAEANNALEKATFVARSKYSDEDYQYGIELNHIARLQIKLGLYEKAEENINKSLKILEEFRKDESKKVYLIQAIQTQAALFGIKGLFDEAEDALNRSSRIISKADNISGSDDLNTANELSSLLIQLGRYSATQELLLKLTTEYEKLYGTNSVRLIEPLINTGKLSLARGDYTEASKIADRANSIAVSVYGEKSTKTAFAQKLMADIDYAIGDYENAEDFILKALESQEKQFGRNHIEVAKSLAQLGIIKFYKGDKPAEVEKIMYEAQEIMGAKLGKENPQYADILKSVAIVKISEKKYAEAFSALTQAEAIWRNKTGTKTNINAASIYTLTGDLFYQTKNYKKAEEFYTQARDIYEKYFNRTHPEYVKILSKQAKVYYMEGNFKRSKSNIEQALNNYDIFIKQYFPALSEREKAKYWNTIKGDFEFYNTLAFSQLEDFRDLTGKVYDYQLLTKALLLSSSIKIRERILSSNDEALKNSYLQWIQKKEFLTIALSMSTEQLIENGIDPIALTAEIELLEREISEKSELFSQSFDNKKITYSNVQKALNKNEVAIEMIRFRHFDHSFTDSIAYVALYVKGDNARPKAILMPNGHQMEKRYLSYYRNAIINKMNDAFSYQVFWQPIQDQIGTNATVYLSPDGVYNQINLEAIPTPDGRFVIDNSNIVMVSNTKDLHLRRIKKKQAVAANKATMFGNPTFYLTASTRRNVPSLPGTEKEVDELQTLLKKNGWVTDEYVEASASEDQVKSLSSPKIFHIATHGFYTPAVSKDELAELTESEAMMTENPLLKTGLLLTGAGDILNKTNYNYNLESGILTAYEAMSLNLDQTDLVVLSACETGLGDISNGEGVYGLQRAFLVAGAKVLIMSMFKVDDDATQKLILNFYRKWIATNNLRQSFVSAKKELRLDYPEPIYWGAFMMIGLEQ